MWNMNYLRSTKSIIGMIQTAQFLCEKNASFYLVMAQTLRSGFITVLCIRIKCMVFSILGSHCFMGTNTIRCSVMNIRLQLSDLSLSMIKISKRPISADDCYLE